MPSTTPTPNKPNKTMALNKSVRRAVKASYHHGDLRDALINTALMLVRKQGVESFSLREAAKLVGVSPSAVYRHFEDKGALLAAVAQAGFNTLALETEAAMKRAARKKDAALAVLQATGTTYVLFALKHPEQFRVMFGPYGAGSAHDVRGADSQGRDPYQQLVEALGVLAGQQRLRMNITQEAALQAWSFTHGLAHLLLDGVLPAPPGEVTSFVQHEVEQMLQLWVIAP
jgi:AcrR family transcriptional regulator